MLFLRFILCFVVCVLGVYKLPCGAAVVLLCFHLNTGDDRYVGELVILSRVFTSREAEIAVALITFRGFEP